MARELFKNLPDTSTPINASKLNGIFNGEEAMGSIVVDDIKCKNLLYTPYTEDNKFTITALTDDYAVFTGYHAYLEAGKTYTFSFETDGIWGDVETFLLKDNTYETFIPMYGNPWTYIPTVTGDYYLRCDVNIAETTHSFWNFQIEEGDKATNFVPCKEFSNKQIYSTNEQVIGIWMGKPLYRKTLVATCNAATNLIVGELTDIDYIEITRGNVEFMGGDITYYSPASYETSENFTKFYVAKYSNAHALVHWVGNTTTGTIHVTVEYTKTTD